MTCQRISPDLDAFLDAELDAERARALAAHVEDCPSCRKLLASARAVQEALRAEPVPGPSDELLGRLLQRAEAAGIARRSARGPRWAAAGFIGAFAASIATVVLTGLWVRAPSSKPADVALAVDIAPHQSRTVNLVFAAPNPLDDVALIVELPEGVEIAGHEGRRELGWNTRLSAGSNVLPLELVATGGRGGRLVARLRHGDKEKVFVVNISVS
jgi:hypothetical protein